MYNQFLNVSFLESNFPTERYNFQVSQKQNLSIFTKILSRTKTFLVFFNKK